MLASGKVLLVLLATVMAPVQPWTEFKSPEGGFAIRFPRKPDYEVQPAEAGSPTIHMYTSALGDDVYIASFHDMPISGALDEVQGILHSARDGFAGGVGGKVADQKPFTFGPLKGLEFAVEAEGVYATARLYLVGKRLYQIAVMGSKDNRKDTDVRRYLESFRLLNEGRDDGARAGG
ncbi:MAG: hypothetical protein AMXMBFR81_10820 [Chthonomonas sp.]